MRLRERVGAVAALERAHGAARAENDALRSHVSTLVAGRGAHRDAAREVHAAALDALHGQHAAARDQHAGIAEPHLAAPTQRGASEAELREAHAELAALRASGRDILRSAEGERGEDGGALAGQHARAISQVRRVLNYSIPLTLRANPRLTLV